MRNCLSVAALPVLALVLLVGCGGDQSGTTARVGDTEVTVGEDGEAGRVTVTGEGGEPLATMTTGSVAAWPEAAPAHAPAYPGGRIVATMASGSGGSAGAIVTFETGDAPEKIIDFYRERAAAAGLDKVTTMALPEMTTFAATDASGVTGVSVQASVNEGRTTASVTFTEPAK